jgi:hypothetical protein
MKLIIFIFLLLPIFTLSQIKYVSDNIIGSLKGEIVSEKQKNDTIVTQVEIPYNDINIVKSQISYIAKKHNSELKNNWIYLNDEYYCEYKQNKKVIKIKFIPDKQLLILKYL